MSDQRIWDIARGFQPSRILLTAVELGIFAEVGEGAVESVHVAERIGADARGTDRLMNALVAIGLLEKEGDRFRNSEDAREYLVPGKPGCVGGALLHNVRMWDAWTYLTESVRGGTSFGRVQHEQSPDQGESFMAAMHNVSTQRAVQVTPLMDFAGVANMLDVGGGSGGYSIAFCNANPGLKSTVLDLPEITPITRRYIAEAGLSDRISVVEGDFNKNEFGDDFDLVYLSMILHQNSNVENVALLQRAWRALKPGGRAVVHEFVLDEQRVSPPNAAVFSLNMLVATPEGDSYTESEIGGWLTFAGYKDVMRRDVPPGLSALMIGTKP